MELNVVVLGATSSGKSSLVSRYCSGTFSEKHLETIEDSYRKRYLGPNKHIIDLEILDKAGAGYMTATRDLDISNGHGFILMYDVTSKASFDELSFIKNQIREIKEPEEVPIVLVANKCDLEPKYRQVSTAQGRELASLWQCEYQETSAKTGLNVDEVFEQLIKEGQRMHPKKKHQKCLIS